MYKEDCIFCKIANGEIPSSTIYEDEDFRVFLDLNPATRGHALLVPKKHFANLLELDDGLCEKAMVLAKKLAGKMTELLGCDGFNLMQNNGEAAGQTVFHFHLHLIPRYKDDTAGITWRPGNASSEELEVLVALLKGK
ncbi:MAG: HIT family protein [Lachnospiraceae bacterium]|nr:HIT family protein [Lachnospiraceae bacterium]